MRKVPFDLISVPDASAWALSSIGVGEFPLLGSGSLGLCCLDWSNTVYDLYVHLKMCDI
jgi:hypothetical protein